ncbi:aminopeptidase P family protein [Prolixibacter denitrificans]|uniref:Xaa-Pro aminopeptidase n=1 Tax=Prolixibacter denitrificans TaxID=1541063 RepID=A0A2P8CAF9_9BACT|nr:aminopeptidase P family protein [Prolixibacter denitrificans]PSK81950.1 Xaa-Pro aminopeptidase [Prolixibacter denitrificans]GET22547.1 Xaa-Pro aminopeptidase [Prolixibacter denitrificans]
MTVPERLAAARDLMKQRGIDAWIISGTDPHMSEYLPKHWYTREWISGFTGSYGKVVVTQNEAILSTDSRYFLQADEQLAGTGIQLMKDLRQPGDAPYISWLKKSLPEGSRVAINGLTIPVNKKRSLEASLGAKGITLDITIDLVSELWDDRPSLPNSPAYELMPEFAGTSRKEKLATLQNSLLEKEADGLVITALDELAWIFNLRGSDIDYNPVFVGYGYIDREEAHLFVPEGKIDSALSEKLESEGIRIHGYDEFLSFVKNVEDKTLLIDPSRTSALLFESVPKSCRIVEASSLANLLKSVKGPIEIEGMKKAHVRDGAAMVNFLYWLENHLGKEKITELTVDGKLREFRAEQDLFAGESFHSIVGYADHGAVVHYSVTEETDKEVLSEGFLLIDSGGQYLDGTTDITRTVAVGPLSDQQKRDFTLVLRGMIGLSLARFPEGTRGVALDILARKPLWDNDMDYGHGTGHGVGHFLNVHEGPMSIRQDLNPEPIRLGQILSNEPGIYKTGQYGIRTENMILCVPGNESEFGQFLKFETLTRCPIDTSAVIPELLTTEEREWLNDYHHTVLQEVGPLVSTPVREWLTAKCARI